MPETRIRSSFEVKGPCSVLFWTIFCAVEAPTPGKVSNSSAVAVFMLTTAVFTEPEEDGEETEEAAGADGEALLPDDGEAVSL